MIIKRSLKKSFSVSGFSMTFCPVVTLFKKRKPFLHCSRQDSKEKKAGSNKPAQKTLTSAIRI